MYGIKDAIAKVDLDFANRQINVDHQLLKDGEIGCYVVDFVHRAPMTVIPMGAMAEIDCGRVTFTIMEAGVV